MFRQHKLTSPRLHPVVAVGRTRFLSCCFLLAAVTGGLFIGASHVFGLGRPYSLLLRGNSNARNVRTTTLNKECDNLLFHCEDDPLYVFFLQLSTKPVPVYTYGLHTVRDFAQAAIAELDLSAKLGRVVTPRNVDLFILSPEEARDIEDGMVMGGNKGTLVDSSHIFAERLRKDSCLCLELKESTFEFGWESFSKKHFFSNPASSSPLVCVCSPFRDGSPSLFLETQHSLQNQTLSNWQHIVVDDYSTNPDSIAALQQAAANDQRVRLVHASTHISSIDELPPEGGRVGLGNARKIGVKECRAPYIMFLDPDDLLHPTALEKFVFFLHSHSAAHFVSSYVVGFGARSYLWQKAFQRSADFAASNDATCMTMHKTASLQAVGHSSRWMGLEDWDTWLRYANAGMWGGTIPEFLVKYRWREDHHKRWNMTSLALETFRSSIPKRFPRLANEADWPLLPTEQVSTYSLDLPQILPFGSLSLTATTAGKLMLIIPWMVLGGADRFNLDTLFQMNAMGWRVTILTTLPSSNQWMHLFEEITTDIILLPNILPASMYLEAVHNIIFWRQIDIVVVAGSQDAYYMLPFLAKAHPRVVFLDILHMQEEYWRGGGHPRLSLAMQPNLDASFVVSHNLRNWMLDHGGSKDRIHVRYIGIDSENWVPDVALQSRNRLEMGIPHDALVVIYASRFDTQKQPLLFARLVVSLFQYNNKNNHLYFLIGGSGSLEPEMRTELDKVPSVFQSHVHWLGAIAPDKMHDILNMANILILPSVMEGIPLVFFEAMALGIVIIASDVGGNTELIKHDVTGFLVEPTNAGIVWDPKSANGAGDVEKQLRTYSSHILFLSNNPEILRRMSAAAREEIKRFSKTKMFQQLNMDFRALVAEKQSFKQEQNVVTQKELSIEAETYRLALRVYYGEKFSH